MIKTIVVNLYGGPGCGKSTTAAGLFYEMKRRGESAELVREYVKDWAWSGRTPGPFDQPHFFGEQSQREAMLYGKVRFVVTDSPLWLSAVYDDHNLGMEEAVRAFLQHAADHGVCHVHYVLSRTKQYDPAGRFQTEAEACDIDDRIVDFLRSRSIPFTAVNQDDAAKVSWLLQNLDTEVQSCR